MIPLSRTLLLIFIILLFPRPALPVEEAGTIVVTGEKDKPNDRDNTRFYDETTYNEDETEYINSDTFFENVPSQKRITPKQALGIAGVQGDPLKALKVFAGVTSPHDASGQLYIHGSKPRENSVSINHLPIGYLYHFGGIHSIISPESIDQIDAYLGGFDVTYSNAMGGVIDITPKYPSGKRKSYLHLGIYDSSAGSSIPLSKEISAFVGARRSYFDLLAPKTGKLSDDVTYTQFPNFWDTSAIISLHKDNSLFTIETISANDRFTIHSEENKIKDPEATGNINANSAFTTTGLRWLYDNNKRYRANTLIYNFELENALQLFDDYHVNAKIINRGFYHLSNLTLQRHRLSAGLEYNHSILPLDLYIAEPPNDDTVGYDFTSARKIRYNKRLRFESFGIFMQDIHEIVTKKLFFRYGLRIDDSTYEKYTPTFDPRLAVVYNISLADSLSLSVGKYSQAPDGIKNIDQLGNKELTFEKAYHYTLNHTHRFSRSIKLVIEPYYKEFSNLAVSEPDQVYVNSGKGYSYGLDVTYNQRPTNRVTIIAAYTYLKAARQLAHRGEYYDFHGEILHTFQVIGNYLIGKNWIFSTRLQYHTGPLYSPIVQTGNYPDGRIKPIYGVPFSERLPDYFSLDLKLSKKAYFKNSSFEMSLEIMNATNHSNVAGIRYDDSYNKEGYIKQLPLLPWLDFVYRF